MDIDQLFKVPKIPTGGIKRKLPDNPTPEMLKKMKMGAPSSTPITSPLSTSGHDDRSSSRKATVEDEEDDENGFAPGGDADYFAEEDDEGRFFGGGLTSEQKEILNIFDKAEDNEIGEDIQDISITQIRKLLLAFERAVNKNQDQRSKYPDDPSKFIDSEADLDSAIKALLPLSQSPILAYPELVRSGTLALITGLLTHENVDIVIDVVDLIYELTDEDAEVDYEDDEYEASQEALKILIEGLVQNSTLELLVDNLSRLNETEEADRQGVFHVLGIFENMIGFNPSLSSNLVSKTKVLPWLLDRIQAKKHDENRGYAAELISILLQDRSDNQTRLGDYNGVEIILKVLSQFRRRDPVDAEETEFMENLFDALCSSLAEDVIKKMFLEAEGPDLMLLMMKEKKESKSRSIKVLDYALSGTSGTPLCETFVEILGLKTLFTAFMGKTVKRQKAAGDVTASEDTGHILGIISSLLTNLPSDSASRIRVMAKFVEGNYEKVEKLLELREGARKRLLVTDAELEKEKQGVLEDTVGNSISPDLEDDFYVRRLEGGLFSLQTIDYILAWLIVEDDGIRTHALRMLDRNNQSLKNILQTLEIYEDHMDDDEVNQTEGSVSRKEILQGLISALHSDQ
ncbi:Beta-catenin-like protein 1 [Psilocybe cubensis]|uniref:Beta-catenin-like protein 1 n=2 Tax=Psilocybe cubensis TaxID=181762 RepID=A0ACB8H3X7_PSICU|nr:Beta-catenin-like protein 1 [Psilocybe cubensis]KAH9482695.1 Beta-catenin-like protein 1 [Psilocybe cubensis]